MPDKPKVLIVDDEVKVARRIQRKLNRVGFSTKIAQNGVKAIEMFPSVKPDIVSLDDIMPGLNGLEVMRWIHERSSVPVVIVASKDRDMDKIRGLELGAADYITKPFRPMELAARFRAIMRRTMGPLRVYPPEKNEVVIGNVKIFFLSRMIKKNDIPLPLTRTEWLLLKVLIDNPNQVLRKETLLEKVWGPEYREDYQYLKVWIKRLRDKLEDNPNEPQMILTVPGIGYTFRLDSES